MPKPQAIPMTSSSTGALATCGRPVDDAGSTDLAARLWARTLEQLRPRLGSDTYELWLRPLAPCALEAGRLRLRAPSEFVKCWFENHYLAATVEALRATHAPDASIEVEVDPAGPAQHRTLAEPSAPHEHPAAAERAHARARPAPATPPRGLSSRYRFDTFVSGPASELAYSAARAAAADPGGRFNPLFIYGDVGLGKTHLLHAVGHEIHAHSPHLRIVLVGAEQFMNEYVDATRSNQFEAYRRRYRQEVDVLLVDDIQFIAGRARTMDEFFHVFNALYEAGKQIMLTSDRLPADLAGMEDRLTSRLNWGLVADIRAPDEDTRAAIVRQRAAREGLHVPPDAASALARHVYRNVRELEGALLRVATLAKLRGQAITPELVDRVMAEVARDRRPAPRVTIDAIQKAVAAHFGLRVSDLKGPRRHRAVARPRMLAMYLARERTQASFPAIGQAFGGRDHSTALSACRRIEALVADDPELADALGVLRRKLGAA